MNSAAFDSVHAADLLVMMTDAWDRPPKKSASAWNGDPDPLNNEWLRPGDREIITALKKRETKVILAINKVDLARDKTKLLPMLEAYSKAFDFVTIVPVSVRRETGIDTLLKEIAAQLPEGEAGYDDDTLTNRPVLFFVQEYIREAVLNQLSSEVPHAVAVSIDFADERPGTGPGCYSPGIIRRSHTNWKHREPRPDAGSAAQPASGGRRRTGSRPAEHHPPAARVRGARGECSYHPG
jgi:GTPase Era involved in 16S rRNA processing